jgi:pimeloyl-ACP methyl ester carboxylesterase
MGGWLGLRLAVQRQERIKAFIGIAAAPDFTEDLIWQKMTEDQRAALERDGFIASGHAPITSNFIQEARQHLLLQDDIPVTCPVRLLQGVQDTEVPWQYAFRITKRITQKDVRVTFIKDGDHRLSRPQDLDMLWRAVEEFLPPSALRTGEEGKIWT